LHAMQMELSTMKGVNDVAELLLRSDASDDLKLSTSKGSSSSKKLTVREAAAEDGRGRESGRWHRI